MNAKEVQRKLWEQSKTHKENREASSPLFPTNMYDNRIRNLFDLTHQPDWLNEAASRVYDRSRGKAPGVDGVTVSEFRKHGTENLQTLRSELKKRIYRPQPLPAVIRGWSNYFKIAHNFSAVAGMLDHTAHWAMVKVISRKFGISSKRVHRKFYFNGRIGVSPGRTLVRFSDTKMLHGSHRPIEYKPGNGTYLEDNEWEVDFRRPHKTRPGQRDLKQIVLERDDYKCRECDNLVVSESSQLDHIRPVHRFASFEQANTLDNVQTLCVNCHQQKSRLERRV